MWDELKMFGRYAAGLRAFFKGRMSPEASRGLLKKKLQHREESLIGLLREGVWRNPRSPYLPLFRNAGIEFGDVDALIQREGVDQALVKLRDAGVYVTLDEFKGKKPILRPGLEHPVSHMDFDNPLINAHFEGKTGGTGGTRRRLLIDLGMLEHDAAAQYVFLDSFGLVGRPNGIWRAVPPNNSGIKKPLMMSKMGLGLERWYSELPMRWGPEDFKYSAFGAFTVAVGRLSGYPFPYPQYVPGGKIGTIVDWMAENVKAGRPVNFDSSASSAVRICAEATRTGRDISGTFFRTGSEALTPARVAIIEKARVRVAAHYASSETGPIGMACSEGQEHDDVHVLMSKMAVIQKRAGDHPDNLLLTTLATTSPKLMINIDSGDSGRLVKRHCGCGFGQLGFDQHISEIRSYEKLTCEGILLPASDVLRLVEETLPGAFGGAPTDYQLVEDRVEGLSRVRIAVSPRVGPVDEGAVVEALLSAIHAGGAGGRLMANRLREAKTLSVMRCEPFQTPAAKVMPLFVIRES